MPRVNPPKRTDTCPGCRGSKRNELTDVDSYRRDPCEYCEGVGKVTNHKYKTLLRYMKAHPREDIRKRGEPTLQS